MIMNNASNIFIVPTAKCMSSNIANEIPQDKIDISKLNEDELKKLKTQDPFLYYSIPGVNKAELSGMPVDHTKVLQDTSSAMVMRRTRVSTEGIFNLENEYVDVDHTTVFQQAAETQLSCLQDEADALEAIVTSLEARSAEASSSKAARRVSARSVMSLDDEDVTQLFSKAA